MSSANKKYIKTFDALRIIALLGVFLYHLMPNIVPSGYLGVVIFFVMAGFLSMKKIVDREKSVSIKDAVNKIYAKILKLYPALVITIIIVTVIMYFYFKNFLIQYPVDAVSSILSVNNYAQIFRNESYFEAMNSIKPLTHVWALSLEFQFYVFFYLLIFATYKKSNRNKYLLVFFILTVLSIAYSIYLVNRGMNLTRIYYGFDSRLATFLIGAMSALVADGFHDFITKSANFNRLLGIILTLIMIYAMVINFDTDAEVMGIIIIYSILCGFLLLILYSEDKIASTENLGINKFKNTFDKVTTVMVNRSYIVYLVHYPIIIFSNRLLAHVNVNMRIFFIAIILTTIIVTEVVYRLSQLIFFNHGNKKLSTILLLVSIFMILGASSLIRNEVGTAPKSEDKNDTTWLTNESETYEYLGEEIIATDSDVQSGVINDGDIYDKDGRLLVTNEEFHSYKVQTVFQRINMVNALIGGDAILTREEFLENRNMKISFIGDSVTQGSRGSLSVYFPNAVINAEGNRQLRKALPIFYEMKEKGELGDVVVVALGTNSDKDIRVDVLEEIYENLDGRMMVILTVAIPYVVQEQQRNEAIRRFADTHDNCHLADWYSTMKTHKEYFMSDGTHIHGLGTDAYAQLIFKTAIEGLEWRKVGNEWQYFGSGDKMKFALEIEKNIGDTVEFGSYYINSDEKKEPIEWIIVDKNEEMKTELLMSKYALERKKYNGVYASTIWQKSEIRKWLNKEFYNEAFENVGAKFILTSHLDNHKNPEYRSADANVTYDRVFLPSYEELKKYVSENDLKCKATEHFKSVGGYVNEDGYVDWWTRTVGDTDSHIVNVSENGEIVMRGDYVTTDDFAVRPMIMVTYK